jgi:hypothetical protein
MKGQGYVAVPSMVRAGVILVVLIPALSSVPALEGTDCMRGVPVVTSEVTVQVFSLDERGLRPLANAEVSVLRKSRDAKRVASGLTDESGYLHLARVPLGE